MKEAIEKAVKKGLFKEDIKKTGNKPCECHFNGFPEIKIIQPSKTFGVGIIHFEGSVADLIFTTPFIECLVGIGRIQHCLVMGFPEKCNRNCDSTCQFYGNKADYHREQMANIKDVEKLKEYIRGLI